MGVAALADDSLEYMMMRRLSGQDDQGRLRRGHFVIIHPVFWFVCGIPIGTTHVSDE